MWTGSTRAVNTNKKQILMVKYQYYNVFQFEMDIFHCSVSLSCYHLQMLLMILKECGPQISATTETLKIQSALW